MSEITDLTKEVLETILYCDLRNSIGIDKATETIRSALVKARRGGYEAAIRNYP